MKNNLLKEEMDRMKELSGIIKENFIELPLLEKMAMLITQLDDLKEFLFEKRAEIATTVKSDLEMNNLRNSIDIIGYSIQDLNEKLAQTK